MVVWGRASTLGAYVGRRQFEFYFVFRDVVDIVYVVTGAVASPEFVGFVGHDPDVLG